MRETYTEQQVQEFQEQFREKRKRQILLAIPFVAAIIAVYWLKANPETRIGGMDPQVFGIGFLVFAIAALSFSFWNWRCPACNGYLGRNMNPKFCGKCGVELR